MAGRKQPSPNSYAGTSASNAVAKCHELLGPVAHQPLAVFCTQAWISTKNTALPDVVDLAAADCGCDN